MQRGDGGLGLVLAQPIAAEGRLEHVDALGDQADVPAAAILLGQRHQPAAGGGPGRAPRVVQQHEREQAGDLLMADGGGQLAGQPDRLGGQVDIARVALVEDQVEHPQHGGDVARLIEPDAGDGPLGPADPLGHGRLRHQVRLRDLTGGEAADRAQREGDGRGRRQRRVRAQEVQLERVVGCLARAGRGLALDPCLAVPPRGLGPGGVEELAPGDRDQPALGIPGRIVRPPAQGFDQGFLHGVLGRREVSSATAEDRRSRWG